MKSLFVVDEAGRVGGGGVSGRKGLVLGRSVWLLGFHDGMDREWSKDWRVFLMGRAQFSLQLFP